MGQEQEEERIYTVAHIVKCGFQNQKILWVQVSSFLLKDVATPTHFIISGILTSAKVRTTSLSFKIIANYTYLQVTDVVNIRR